MNYNCLRKAELNIDEKYEQVEDVFDISSRLKEIDDGYVLLLSRERKQLEVHNTNQKGCSFVCVVDFLDNRIIDTVLKTRIENFDKVIQEIDDANEKMDRVKNEKIKEYSKTCSKEAFSLAEKKGGELKTLDFLDIKKCLGEQK